MKQRGFFCTFVLLFAGVLPGQPAARVSKLEALPQAFEPNLGQADSKVRFVSHGRGVGLFLTPSEVMWSLTRRDTKDAPPIGSAVRMKLLDANANVDLAGVHLLPGRSNYIQGNDPSRWRANVPRYEKVQYRNLYPGVDLVFYRSSERRLEFDFLVAPGADPRKIQLAFEGARSISIEPAGDILLSTPAGDIRTKAPRVYQQSKGQTKELSGRYVMSGRNRVSFRVAAYDRSLPLIIDPVVVTYATFLGGTGTDVGQDVGEDAAGNLYVAGITSSTNFPTTAGANQTTFDGVEDAFVTKLNVQTGIVYSTYIGGTGDEQARSMAVTDSGDVYITGPTNSTNFPTTAGAFQKTAGGACSNGPCAHAFVAHLNPSGMLAYATYLGSMPGSGNDVSQGIAVDAAGNAYISGTTSSSSFPTTAGAFRRMFGGGNCNGSPCADAFVAKLNPSGTALVYSTYLGGSNQDIAGGIAVDHIGNAFVTGSSSSSDFPTTAGAYQTKLKVGTCRGLPCSDAFVVELNPSGSALVYSTLLGGVDQDSGVDIDVDGVGQAYVIGTTSSSDFPTAASAFQPKYAGGADAFVTALNASGTALVASTYVGGTGTDLGEGISVSDAGEIIVAIDTGSTPFLSQPAGQGAVTAQDSSVNSSIVATLDAPLEKAHSTIAGGNDSSKRKARKRRGRTCATGASGETDNFSTTMGAPQPRFGGGNADAVLICTQDAAAQPPLAVTPQSLTFNATEGGPMPASQSLAISSTTGQPVAFSISTDIGTPTVPAQADGTGSAASSPSPAWLIVTPSNGTTPALVIVSVNPNRATLTKGTFTARIVIGVPGSSLPPAVVTVTLVVTGGTPKLGVAPTSLSFLASVNMPRTFQQTIVVQNTGGGGAASFTVSTPNRPGWLKIVTPMSGTLPPGSPVFAVVEIDSTGLPSGGQKTIIIFASNGTTIPVTISLFVANAGSILGVSQTGLFFEFNQGQGIATPQTLEVLDDGDSTSSIAYTAMIANSANFLDLSPTTGTASPGKPAVIAAKINSNGQKLGAGVYYALVKITDSKAQDSPRYVVVVLRVLPANTPPKPDPFPRGLVFIAAPGGVLPAPQTITVYTSSSADVSFQASASLANGETFLTVSPASGMLSTQNPAQLTASVNIAGVPSGVYQGTITISIGGVFVSVDVTIIVLPPGNFSPARETGAMAPALMCTPSRIVLTQTGLPNGFSVPGGFPATLAVLMNDDCGNKITSGSVVASFSNGDPALALRSDLTGMYSATWQPGTSAQQMTVSANGTSGALQPGSVQITGTISQNPAPPPVLAHGGTVNNAYAAGALSPGVVAAVFGANLASKTASPGVVPLLTKYQGTSLLVGANPVPLFFVSGGQVNVQIPAELTPGQYQIIASFNGALALPDTIDVNAVGPGVVALADGHVIAQHSNGKLVKSTNPAKPGETIVIYLVGLGATDPAVESGHPAPSNPLAKAVVKPVVTVDGQKAKVPFAGLTPGGVGLYQIDLTVPTTARNGDLDLVVTQNGVAANTTKLTVSK